MEYTKLGNSDLKVSRICMEEPYTPHCLVGVMAQNTVAAKTEKKVWTTSQR